MSDTLLKAACLRGETTIVCLTKQYNIIMQRGEHTEVLDTVYGESARNDAITRYATALVRRNEHGRIYSEVVI